MKKNHLRALLNRLITGKASDREINLLDKFIYYSQIKSEKIPEGVKPAIWEKVKANTIEKQPKVIAMAPIWRVAASITVILGIAIVLYLSQSTPDINYLIEATGRGQKATITLSDGSVVKLNSESSITYPESFSDVATRDIKLSGEAFFEVKRDETKSFTIQTGDIVTTVLGTSFNISAFPDMDEIEVTVTTGRVKVESNDDVVSELIPGQQASYSRSDNLLKVGEVDIRNYTAWKDGTIYLSDMTLLEASKILSRWYNVDFQFSGQEIKNCKIDGKFKNDQLVNVLENLQFVIDFQFQIIDGDVVVIKGKGCN